MSEAAKLQAVADIIAQIFPLQAAAIDRIAILVRRMEQTLDDLVDDNMEAAQVEYGGNVVAFRRRA